MQKLLSFTSIFLMVMTLIACRGKESVNTENIKQAAPVSAESEKVQLTAQEFALSVEGDVWRDNGLDYHIDIKIKNIGKRAIKYDERIGGFFPKKGRPLIIINTAIDHTERAEQGSGKEKMELVPGAIDRVEFEPGGHTRDLFEEMSDDKRNASLHFSLLLSFEGKRVMMPFTTELPLADFDLPPYRYHRSDEAKGRPLSFRNAEPYKNAATLAGGRTRNLAERFFVKP